MLRLYEKLNCTTFTTEEKEACLPLVRKLMGINNESIRNSFLSLEDDVENMNEEKDFFLKTALQLVYLSAGFCRQSWEKEPFKKGLEAIEDIMWNLVIADKSTGEELLGRLLIIRAVMSLANCEEAMLVCYQLLSMLGTEYLKNYFNDYVKSEYIKL